MPGAEQVVTTLAEQNGEPPVERDAIAVVGGFETAAVTEVRRSAAEPQADMRVSAAFALGWQVADLYRTNSPAADAPASQDDLPGVGRLAPDERRQLAALQLKAGLAKVSPALIRAGLDMPTAPDLGTIGPKAIRSFHVALLQRLTAADFRLGKAYGLGRSLSDTCQSAATGDELIADRLKPGRIENIRERLAELTTAFPPHAGHAVNLSLAAWQQWADATPADAKVAAEEAVADIRREGRRWRALLSGEKLATDMLTTDDYLTAGEMAMDTSGSLSRRFVHRFKWVLFLLAAVFGGGVALVFVVGSAASVATGAGAILASLGLSWKGVGSLLGKLAARLEEPLWGSELDRAIASHINRGPAAGYVQPPAAPGRRLPWRRAGAQTSLRTIHSARNGSAIR